MLNTCNFCTTHLPGTCDFSSYEFSYIEAHIWSYWSDIIDLKMRRKLKSWRRFSSLLQHCSTHRSFSHSLFICFSTFFQIFSHFRWHFWLKLIRRPNFIYWSKLLWTHVYTSRYSNEARQRRKTWYWAVAALIAVFWVLEARTWFLEGNST